MRAIAIGLIALMASALLQSQAATGPPPEQPPLSLNPHRSHVIVFLSSIAPTIKLYEKRNLSGPPVIVLDERGLLTDGRLVCSWPGGRFDGANDANMVLGYSKVAADSSPVDYQGCPPGLPVISTWGDGGKGTAALYLEVTGRRGSIIELRYGRRRLWFDLNSLAGDPRVPLDASFHLQPKGKIGWGWAISDIDSRKQNAAMVTKLMKEPSFARFLRDVRTCLTSDRVPDCFIPFVHDDFYCPEAAPNEPLGPASAVTPATFTRYAWTATRSETGDVRMWNILVGCLMSPPQQAGGLHGLTFESHGFFCVVDRDAHGWKLTEFFAGE